MFLINGRQPGPAIDVDEGDTIEVFVQNDLKVDTALHWHGMLSENRSAATEAHMVNRIAAARHAADGRRSRSDSGIFCCRSSNWTYKS